MQVRVFLWGHLVQFEAGGRVSGADPDCKKQVYWEGQGCGMVKKQEWNLAWYRSSLIVVLGPAASA